MKQEIKQLTKENKQIRSKIYKILIKKFSSIDDEYNDLWGNIHSLINNEIEQEKYYNQI